MKLYRKMSFRHFLLFTASFLTLLLLYRSPSNGYVPNAMFIESNSSESNRCAPSKKIAFMKTHKCASSTVENILFRYAHQQDLNLVMPYRGNYLSTEQLFNREIVTSTPWGKLDFNIFTLHNRWNYQEVIQLMGNETKLFSVVRDPVDLFESLYGYMKMSKTYGTSIKDFVKLVSNGTADEIVNKRRSNRFGRNQIAWDWGIQPQLFDHELFLKKKIQSFDQQFELVLVAERLEESLVLLRHLLCWPTEHITHLVLNKRKREKKVKLDPEEREQLKKWLKVDYMIYDHYVKVFEEKVQQFNSEHGKEGSALQLFSSITPMEKEVLQLREANSKVIDKCVIDHVGNEKLNGKFRETNNDIMGYLINEDIEECQLYAMSEPAYLTYFRKRLISRSKELKHKRKDLMSYYSQT